MTRRVSCTDLRYERACEDKARNNLARENLEAQLQNWRGELPERQSAVPT
jgi:hypothetical protein